MLKRNLFILWNYQKANFILCFIIYFNINSNKILNFKFNKYIFLLNIFTSIYVKNLFNNIIFKKIFILANIFIILKYIFKTIYTYYINNITFDFYLLTFLYYSYNHIIIYKKIYNMLKKTTIPIKKNKL